jgi:hypothetical protein
VCRRSGITLFPCLLSDSWHTNSRERVRDDAEWRLVVDFDGDRESLGQKCFGMSLDAEMDFERLIPGGVLSYWWRSDLWGSDRSDEVILICLRMMPRTLLTFQVWSCTCASDLVVGYKWESRS